MPNFRFFIFIFCLGITSPVLSQSDTLNQRSYTISNDTIYLQNSMEFYARDLGFYLKDKDKETRNLFVKIDEQYVYYNRKKNKLDYDRTYKDIFRVYDLVKAPYGSYILIKEDGSYDCIYFSKGKLKTFKKPIFGEFTKDQIMVLRNGKIGMINQNLEIVLPIEYDHIGFMMKAKGKKIYKGKKEGFFYKKLVLEAKYDSITNFVFRSYHKDADVFVYPSLNGKMGVFDFDGNEVLPFIYDQISPYFATGFLDVDTSKPFLFVVKKDNKFGVVNSKNDILVPIEFDNEAVLDKKVNEIYGITD